MTLITGSAYGNIITQEDLYFDGAPQIYYQKAEASLMFNPDADGYYWQLSGTTQYPVYALGCVNDVSLTENLTMNDVMCDAVGVQDTIQRRNYLEFALTIQTFFPLSTLVGILKSGQYTRATGLEKFGIGTVQSQFFHAYCPKVYDESVGDYIAFTLHRAKFVDAFTIAMRAGNNWQITGVKLRAFADSTKPSTQSFATVVRSDVSALP